MDPSFILLFLSLIVKCRCGSSNNSIKEIDEEHVHVSDWGYDRQNGPDTWCHTFKMCCGTAQSPVNIDTKSVWPEQYAPLILKNYEKQPTWMNIKNNGHSIYLSLGFKGESPRILDGGLGGTYELASFHFHWGSEDNRGSEHTIDGVEYPIELHVVHFNTKYGSIERAIENSDGIAVLGVLYQIGESDNSALEKIVDKFENVEYVDTSFNTSNIDGFHLIDLFPKSMEVFYRYIGSLTTPKCQEVVTWTVFKAFQTLSRKELEAFRKLLISTSGAPRKEMWDNFRPIQHLRGRKVHMRVSSGPSINTQLSLIIIVLTSTFTYSQLS